MSAQQRTGFIPSGLDLTPGNECLDFWGLNLKSTASESGEEGFLHHRVAEGEGNLNFRHSFHHLSFGFLLYFHFVLRHHSQEVSVFHRLF